MPCRRRVTLSIAFSYPFRYAIVKFNYAEFAEKVVKAQHDGSLFEAHDLAKFQLSWESGSFDSSLANVSFGANRPSTATETDTKSCDLDYGRPSAANAANQSASAFDSSRQVSQVEIASPDQSCPGQDASSESLTGNSLPSAIFTLCLDRLCPSLWASNGVVSSHSRYSQALSALISTKLDTSPSQLRMSYFSSSKPRFLGIASTLIPPERRANLDRPIDVFKCSSIGSISSV